MRQKCLASRNKKEFLKIASQIFDKFWLIFRRCYFCLTVYPCLEILEETETSFVPVSLLLTPSQRIVKIRLTPNGTFVYLYKDLGKGYRLLVATCLSAQLPVIEFYFSNKGIIENKIADLLTH